jgi:hypothetical protein
VKDFTGELDARRASAIPKPQGSCRKFLAPAAFEPVCPSPIRAGGMLT